MQDHFERPYREPVTAVVPHATPVHEKVSCATAGPLLVGALGVMLAAATLAVFLVWKGSVAAQIDQLRNELTTAQSQAASNSKGLSGLSTRVNGIRSDVNSLGDQLGGYAEVCSQYLAGSNGNPATFYFPCQQKG